MMLQTISLTIMRLDLKKTKITKNYCYFTKSPQNKYNKEGW